MIILFDTNIILDILLNREGFFEDSYKALRKATEEGDYCLLSISAVTDIYYVLRKELKSPEKAKLLVEKLSRLINMAEVLESDFQQALLSKMTDFEDALLDGIAYRKGARFIITRNIKDFVLSKVKAITPKEFLLNT